MTSQRLYAVLWCDSTTWSKEFMASDAYKALTHYLTLDWGKEHCTPDESHNPKVNHPRRFVKIVATGDIIEFVYRHNRYEMAMVGE